MAMHNIGKWTIRRIVALAFIGGLLGLSLLSPCEGSLVNKVVLQSLNITSSSSSIDTSLWENKGNGFQVQTLQTQVRVDEVPDWDPALRPEGFPSNFLLARNTASLATVLHNFNHTFLSVHFASYIGSGNEPLIAKPGDKASAGGISSSNLPIIKVTPPEASNTGTTVAKIEGTDTEIVQQPEPPAEVNITQQNGQNQQPPSSQRAPISVSSSSPASAPAPRPAIITSTVTRPNESSSSHIIQITLEHPDSAPSAAVAGRVGPPPPETRNVNIRLKRELDSVEISQVHEIFAKALSNKTLMISDPESKEDSNLEEESQENINRSEAQPQTEAEIETQALPAPESDGPVSISNVPATELLTDSPGPEYKLLVNDDQLPQEAPRNPQPGFRVLVDDQAVYDNWNGIWKSSDLMGNTIQSSENSLWNDTNIYIEIGSLVPHRDVKISFQWEPSDPSSFILLNDITLGTLDGNSGTTGTNGPQRQVTNEKMDIEAPQLTPVPTAITMESTTTSEPSGQAALTPAVLHNNITLFIVVKSQSHDPDPHDRNNDNDTVVEPKSEAIGSVNGTATAALNNSISISNTRITTTKPKVAENESMTSNSSTRTPAVPGTVPVTPDKPRVLNRDPAPSGFDIRNSSDLSAIIVFGLLVVVTILICIGLIHRKLAIRKHQRGRC